MMTQRITRGILVVVMAACLMPGSASAGWDTNVWPAYEHPREVRKQMDDCYNALSERCQVAFWHCTAPAFYRTFRSDLHELKTSLHELFLFYPAYPFAATNLADPDGSYDTWYTNQTCTGDFLSDPLPELSWTGLCSIARIPTNFFTFTPYRSEIAGLGGFTNDIAVIGHAHGYTNATTAAGGPYYPTDRTTWYTTDYGLDALKSAIRCLAWSVGYDLAVPLVYDSDACYGEAYSNTWSDAVAGAEADTTPSGSESIKIGTFGVLSKYTHKYKAQWFSLRWSYECFAPSIATNIARTFDAYEFAGPYGGPPYPNANTFDAHGTPVRQSTWTRVVTTNSTGAGSVTSSVLGSVTCPSPWCDEPPGEGGDNDTGRGFSAGGYTRTILKWTFDYQ